MSDTTGALPPAGWYPDPYGAPYERWWDGGQWTTHTTEAAAAPAAAAAAPVAAPVVETPAYQAPLQETPVFASPAYTPPVADPAPFGAPIETPAFQAPVETPPFQAPISEMPSYKMPAAESPAVPTPAVPTPAVETPGFATPGFETPGFETPGFEAPSQQPPAYQPYVPPVATAPAAVTPAAVTPVATPDYGAALFSAPSAASTPNHDFDFGMLVSGSANAGDANSTAAFSDDGGDTFGSWAGSEYVEPPRNSQATAGLALGILSFFLSALAGIPGIIVSMLGLSKATRLKADGVEKTGRGKAFAGFILSLLGTLVTVAAVLYFFFPSVLGFAPTAVTPPASDGTDGVPDDALTQNGNLALTVGTAGVINAADTTTPAVTFTVTAIQPDFACTSPTAVATENGQFVAVTMEITTAADYLSTMASGSAMHMAESDWEAYSDDSADPLPNSEAGASCIPADQQLPADFAAGQTFTGIVVLDIDVAATAFSWSPTGVTGLDPTQTRWEWALVATDPTTAG